MAPARCNAEAPCCASVKLQQEIWGTFRTEAAARRFAAVRSCVETGCKHGENPLDILIQLFTGNPWMIPSPSIVGTYIVAMQLS